MKRTESAKVQSRLAVQNSGKSRHDDFSASIDKVHGVRPRLYRVLQETDYVEETRTCA